MKFIAQSSIWVRKAHFWNCVQSCVSNSFSITIESRCRFVFGIVFGSRKWFSCLQSSSFRISFCISCFSTEARFQNFRVYRSVFGITKLCLKTCLATKSNFRWNCVLCMLFVLAESFIRNLFTQEFYWKHVFGKSIWFKCVFFLSCLLSHYKSMFAISCFGS